MEAVFHMTYFLLAHTLTFVFFFVWRGHYGACPWSTTVIGLLFASVVLGAVSAPLSEPISPPNRTELLSASARCLS